MWIKLILLLLYLLLLFLLSRLMEVASWYGEPSFLYTRTILDPFALSVRKLKQLLESRGVSYSGVVEKQELTALVEASGNVTEGELVEAAEEAEQTAAYSYTLGANYKPTHFTCGTHFYEEVEDTKDSVWLVQVIPPDTQVPLLDDYTWRQVMSKVASFGVRTGVFECSLDRRLCARKKWMTAHLILALPRGNKAKEDVVIHSYRHPAKSQAVLQWIRQQLATRVRSVGSLEDFHNNWLSYKTDPWSSEIRVVAVSSMPEPPLFLSALAIKFNGRVKFGTMHLQTFNLRTNSDKFGKVKHPFYLVITPEGQFIYGQRAGENLNFKSMETFLKWMRPEMNDTFIFSLFAVNMVAGLELFLFTGKLWKHCMRWLLKLIKYNCILFLLWLLILGLYQFSFMDCISRATLKVLRAFSGTQIASVLRNDWKRVYCSSFFIIVFVWFGVIVGMVWQKCGWYMDEDTSLFSEWWAGSLDGYIMNYFFRPMATLTRPMAPHDWDLEEGMELLIERLAVPNLWLQPVISTDYIKDLPVWRYRGWGENDRPSSDSNDWSSGEDRPDSESENPLPSAAFTKLPTTEQPSNPSPSCSSSNISFSKGHCTGFTENNKLCKNRSCLLKQSEKCAHASHKDVLCKAEYAQELHDTPAINSETPRPSTCSHLEPVDQHNHSQVMGPDYDMQQVSCKNLAEKDEVDPVPPGMLECHECAICLEVYHFHDLLCGLPCGHNYHIQCIMLWLSRDTHCCPVCRWPPYKSKLHAVTGHLHSL